MNDLPERSRLVQQHLVDAGVAAEIRILPDSARTAPEAAAAIGCDVSAIANSLVFVADGTPVLVMTSGGHRVDLDVLARSTGAATIAMAPASVVREATGQAIGGVAPVGHPTRLRTYIDEDLREHGEIWAAAGHPHTVMPLTFETLQHLTDGDVIAVD
ncbi:prolyl-tRNA editing enzyme YbaK/EbsC (Cys-tRNA(Pro) deacylase) [Microbacterium foliorum]|jgi:prolyl-tRNA editing enzyme YbaK/EbsC (Cys-tRNA(Pro) deacylase)|uniref:Prolyl-tRNA editing enzyme YbaK/EbsC (Cys-tRNA(Pro) deacylase) n=1 Tax=Microbacterium foliorum TaxID=104336 RepID=A0ABU1HML9_9MICO|nr:MULTISPECIES: YbaK/EbsC family protein [Microbacterium]AQY01339.1 aminoacyl-tRNA deacylase [Microbacterium foliorum]KIP88193.1 prolyl-tRNA synthetase [Microbacterium sp. MEJ108Y]MDR6141286.1 prolyl-tRNA editing enzyme YbaK/EbsC (Cys-tRNA(Pro) deacylase) [Microbacterium foliorum]